MIVNIIKTYVLNNIKRIVVMFETGLANILGRQTNCDWTQ